MIRGKNSAGLSEWGIVSRLRVMHLYLVRHAHAVDGDNDEVRPLSGKGLMQIRKLGRLLRDADAIEAKEVWHSPLVRALDTAERLAEVLRLPATRRVVAGLRSNDDPTIIAKRLSELRHPVMIVGHEPLLSTLATLLVTGRDDPPRFVFKKCAVLRLDRETGGWTVHWMISPEVV